MKSFVLMFGIIACAFFTSSFNFFQGTIPAELVGKWKLRGQGSKLVGTLELKSDGSFSYNVLPNFKESGTVTVDGSKQPKQITLNSQRNGAAGNVTKGIYSITGAELQLALGKANGDRPANFTAPAGSGVIAWIGNK